MSTPVTMPQLGESVTEGTVTRWLKNIGDRVAVDEPLLEVSTDKVDTEIPSPVAGVLVEILAVEDDVVEVGSTLARVGEAAEIMAATSRPGPTAAFSSSPSDRAGSEAPPAVAGPTTTIPVEPAAEPAVESAQPGPTQAHSRPRAEETAVILPPLGESVTEGTVTRWLKQVGDKVKVDDPLVEISTDKVDTEIPSTTAGFLTRILVAEDETVDVGSTLAYVGSDPAEIEEVSSPTSAPTPGDQGSAASPNHAVRPPASDTGPAAPTSPLVRKLARGRGIDLDSVSGSGPGGRVTRADLDMAGESPGTAETTETPETSDEHTEPMPRLRKVIAGRLVESLRISAQATTFMEIDVTKVDRLRRAVRQSFTSRERIPLSFLPFFVRATVEALKAHPALNASVTPDGKSVTYHDSVHLGIAVDTNRGLLVPVIQHAGDLTLTGLARRIAELAERTRTGNVSPDDLSGGTFTVSNTGSRGALMDTPIINQPQVGILCTGAVVPRPVVITDVGGQNVIAIRSMAYFALTYDHRLADGADAARFLTSIKSWLEDGCFESELRL
ncbi:MAG: 2-oxoglutarate dehydrogenase, E2 component, dihydrolipoamide succinyltransferase [Candidatus Nanopelagicales bacterium]|nr:2-oxoglutarate dehydrogenase, E2 component, dihydrolipoamide succinyltransferase [Candidatus Nanopelagicales bacterium]